MIPHLTSTITNVCNIRNFYNFKLTCVIFKFFLYSLFNFIKYEWVIFCSNLISNHNNNLTSLL